MSMTYTSLQTAVAGYLHRSDLTTQIPDFIDQARLRIGADFRGLSNWTSSTVTTFSSGLTALPTNLAQLVAVIDSVGVPLQALPIEQALQFTGSSSIYAISGSNLYVPGAGASTVITLKYYTIPAVLSAGSDVSVPMVQYPNLWLYASVYEGAMYIQDYELADRMLMAYKALIDDANRAGDEARFGAAPAQFSDQPMIQGMSTL